MEQDMCAINDPLGQIHSPASSDHYSHLKFVFVLRDFEKWERTDVQTPRAKIVITTGRDFGSASWINKTGVINSLNFVMVSFTV